MATSAPTPNRPTASQILGDLRDLLVSLRLTVALLLLSMLLVFAATLDQVNLGIWAVQAKYFRSFLVYTDVGGLMVPIFPGGYTVGGLLLANLIAAHAFRFAPGWRKAGILLVHAGLIILLVGELLTGLWQEDFSLRLDEGETKNYAESFRDHELVLIDGSEATSSQVVAIPERRLARRDPVQHPLLPFRVTVKSFYPNSLLQTGAVTGNGDSAAMAGLGERITAVPQPVSYRQDARNVPAAIVELAGPEGPLGTWLVSADLDAQEFTHAGKAWRIALRLRRDYQPFSLTLVKFTHDRYAGTNIPKNFSSQLRLRTPDGRDDREVRIYMNNPLRYGGLTFYQAGFGNNDRTTVLQVVRNPSWLVPYFACTVMTLGLSLQFGIHLTAFIRRRRTSVPAALPIAAAPATAAR